MAASYGDTGNRRCDKGNRRCFAALSMTACVRICMGHITSDTEYTKNKCGSFAFGSG